MIVLIRIVTGTFSVVAFDSVSTGSFMSKRRPSDTHELQMGAICFSFCFLETELVR